MEYPTYGVKYEMKYGLHMDYKPLSLKWDAHPYTYPYTSKTDNSSFAIDQWELTFPVSEFMGIYSQH